MSWVCADSAPLVAGAGLPALSRTNPFHEEVTGGWALDGEVAPPSRSPRVPPPPLADDPRVPSHPAPLAPSAVLLDLSESLREPEAAPPPPARATPPGENTPESPEEHKHNGPELLPGLPALPPPLPAPRARSPAPPLAAANPAYGPDPLLPSQPPSQPPPEPTSAHALSSVGNAVYLEFDQFIT